MVSERQHYEQDALWGDDNVVNPEHHRSRFEAVVDLLGTGVRSVVDVGAGDGRVLHHLISVRPDVVALAVERSARALAHVQTPAAQGSVDALPLADRSVDAVLCCEVLEHLPPPVYGDALVELARVADTTVVVSVPNREARRRAEIRCASCGCRYNPDRHLRSFSPDGLAALLPGFALTDLRAVGPRPPVYPRPVRLGLERAGLLRRPGFPTCPQCGEPYPYGGGLGRPDAGDGGRRSTYDRWRALAPKRRHPYWLVAAYRRR